MSEQESFIPVLPTKVHFPKWAYSARYNIVSAANVREALTELVSADIVAWDSEFDPTAGGQVVSAFSFSTAPNSGWLIPVRMDHIENMPLSVVEKFIFAITKKVNVVQSAAAEIRSVKHTWPDKWEDLTRIDHDIQIMWFQRDPNEAKDFKESAPRRRGMGMPTGFSLTQMALKYLKIEVPDLKDFFKDHSFRQLDPETARVYACSDADVTLRLYNAGADPSAQNSFVYKLDHAMVRVLMDMEDAGILYDPERQDEIEQDVRIAVAEARKEAYSKLKTDEETVNIDSPKQLARYIFNALNWPVIGKRNKDGLGSTDKTAMARYAESADPLIAESAVAFSAYKRLKTVHNNFLTKLHTYQNPVTQAIHCHFLATVVPTGRLACASPNLQQIPQRNPKIPLRRAFRARPGTYFMEADYCLAPETRVLTSDMRWKDVAKVEAGDELVGFDENIPSSSGHKYKGKKQPPQKLRSSVVERVVNLTTPSYRITMEDGTEIVASADHKWVATDKTARPLRRDWYKTSELTENHVLHRWIQPWTNKEDLAIEDQNDMSYLSGFADGEGWRSGTSICLGQNPGPVLEHVVSLLDKHGFDHVQSAQSGNKVERLMLRGYGPSLRFLGQTRPVRLLAGDCSRMIWEDRSTSGRGRHAGRGTVAISYIEFLGEQEVVAVRTSTGTLIAEGYLSHNSQIELRVYAGETREKFFYDAFIEGTDLHLQTASIIFRESITDKSDPRRQFGKVMNFGPIYGMKPEGLAMRTDYSLLEAERILEDFFAAMPDAVAWTRDCHRKAKEMGGVHNHFGRWRPLPWINSRIPHEVEFGERSAVNTVVQGTAADVMKVGLVRIWKALRNPDNTFFGDVQMVLTVHDSVMLEVNESVDPHELFEFVRQNLCFTVEGYPPLEIDAKIGRNWHDMEDLKVETVTPQAETFEDVHKDIPLPTLTPEEYSSLGVLLEQASSSPANYYVTLITASGPLNEAPLNTDAYHYFQLLQFLVGVARNSSAAPSKSSDKIQVSFA